MCVWFFFPLLIFQRSSGDFTVTFSDSRMSHCMWAGERAVIRPAALLAPLRLRSASIRADIASCDRPAAFLNCSTSPPPYGKNTLWATAWADPIKLRPEVFLRQHRLPGASRGISAPVLPSTLLLCLKEESATFTNYIQLHGGQECTSTCSMASPCPQGAKPLKTARWRHCDVITVSRKFTTASQKIRIHVCSTHLNV